MIFYCFLLNLSNLSNLSNRNLKEKGVQAKFRGSSKNPCIIETLPDRLFLLSAHGQHLPSGVIQIGKIKFVHYSANTIFFSSYIWTM